MGLYAIVKASGRQFWIEENRFYDLNKLPLQPGDTFTLNQVLLVKQNNQLELGKPFSIRCLTIHGITNGLLKAKVLGRSQSFLLFDLDFGRLSFILNIQPSVLSKKWAIILCS